MNLKQLQDEIVSAKAAFKQGQIDGVDDETFDQLEANVKDLEAKYEKESERLSRVGAVVGKELPDAPNGPHITRIEDQWMKDPCVGYDSPTQYLTEVMKVGEGRMDMSPQLRFLAAAGTDEHSTNKEVHGGFLVPEGFRPEVMSVDPEIDPTSSLVTRVPMAVDIVNIPARTDKDHSSSVSGGLAVYRRSETQSVNSSRMNLENVRLEASALMGLSYASEELLERSAVSFIALLEAGFRDEFSSKQFQERLTGVGAGSPVGILNAACTVTVAKEGGQSADTILGANIMKMRQRAWRYGRSIWMANHDTYPQISQAHISLTNDDVPLFVPGNGVDVPDTLLGRPIYFTEYCETLGDKGDIILADWSQYLWGTLGGEGVNMAESMHVRFVNHERTFKFYTYNTGAPWWASPLTPKNSSTTLSPFVTLAARA